jgi:hypothetical protein
MERSHLTAHFVRVIQRLTGLLVYLEQQEICP